MIKSPIFCWDVDGVLIKYDPHNPANDWRKTLIDKGLLTQWEAFQISEEWYTCQRDCQADTVSQLEALLERKGWDPGQAKEIIHIWLTGNTAPNPQALALLKDIRAQGYESIIISNQDGLRAQWLDRWLEENGLGDMHRFISCRIGSLKPDPAFFQAIQVAMGRPPSQLYLFDDNEENIAAALSEGWGGQVVTPGEPVLSPFSP